MAAPVAIGPDDISILFVNSATVQVLVCIREFKYEAKYLRLVLIRMKWRYALYHIFKRMYI